MRALVDPVMAVTHNASLLDKPRIITSLQALDAAVADHPYLSSHPGVRASLRIVGGAAMILRHGSRLGTTDIDATTWPEQGIIEIADRIAHQEGLGLGWLNDAAKRFLPDRAHFEEYLAPVHFQRLSLAIADDATLLAMKCHALRGAKDAADIIVLAKTLRLASSRQLRDHTNHMYGREIMDEDGAMLLEGVVHGHL